MESRREVSASKAGKFRKNISQDGDTERLKKKGREKQTKRSTREIERIKRFEESLKRKERMVKVDKKRSGVMDRGDNLSGIHGNQNYSRCEVKNGRWQVGDGFHLKRDPTTSPKTKSSGEKRNKVRSKNTKICVPAYQRGERKERTKEWIDSINKSFEKSPATCSKVDVRNEVEDIPPTWFIKRLTEEVGYTPVKRPVIEFIPAVPAAPVVRKDGVNSDVIDTQGTTDTCSVPARSNKKSFRSRLVSVFRFLARCAWGKSE